MHDPHQLVGLGLGLGVGLGLELVAVVAGVSALAIMVSPMRGGQYMDTP